MKLMARIENGMRPPEPTGQAAQERAEQAAPQTAMHCRVTQCLGVIDVQVGVTVGDQAHQHRHSHAAHNGSAADMH